MNRFWISFGDIHDQVAKLSRIPELPDAAGVIITGDLTLAKGIPGAKRVMEAVTAINPNCFAQIGNMDEPEVTTYLTEHGWNIHRTLAELTPELAVVGVGTSSTTPFNTPSETPDETLGLWLEETYALACQYKHTIVAVHDTPYDTLCDDLGNGVHVGSKAVRDFIEKHQPELVLCGHIHEAQAVDTIGATTIINAGPLADGGYIKIMLEDDRLLAELKSV
ncbi:MAG: metallophosphoesterase [Desulfovibrionales bacterium]|nr:metallophosphoesterase [Desulfovibrionales bacterium]